ncbi:MAG: hypothetical protein LC126_03390 [Bryobacterales bacterium]|nr:hypothetical protein [Bryobacterales bacterium]
MTDRQRVLATIRGDAPDRIPWIPRMDFWHRARLHQNTLPSELRPLTLPQIADRLGFGCYSTIPDFTDCVEEDDMIDRGLGIFRLRALPYRVHLRNVERRVTRSGRETVVEYHTPKGALRTAFLFTEEMLAGGASMSWQTELPIRKPEDFDAAGYLFENLEVEPRWEGYLARRDEVGERGVVVGWLAGTACPIHHILKELMTVETFYYALADYPEKIFRLCDQMQHLYAKIQEIGANGPAEILHLGANYDDAITYPQFFRQHILPVLRDYAEVLHGKGKYLMTHTDGENRRLIPLYLEAGFDIADSVCPHPMTRLSLDEYLDAFDGRISVWGGIPSTLLCPDSTPEAAFRRNIDALIERHGHRPRLILGVSDMVTADAAVSRLEYITDRVSRIQ